MAERPKIAFYAPMKAPDHPNPSGDREIALEALANHRLLSEGKSDAEIVDFMVTRYGDFVLYRPPVNRHTAVLWSFPVVVLAVGLLVVAERQCRQGDHHSRYGGDETGWFWWHPDVRFSWLPR